IAGGSAPFGQRAQIADDECRMRFFRGPEVGFDAEVKLSRLRSEPRAASFREVLRFRDFHKSEYADVKRSRRILIAGRHCELDVMDAEDGQSTPSSAA